MCKVCIPTYPSIYFIFHIDRHMEILPKWAAIIMPSTVSSGTTADDNISSTNNGIKLDTFTAYFMLLSLPVLFFFVIGNVLVAVAVLKSKRLRTREHVFVLVLIFSALLMLTFVVPFTATTFLCQCQPFYDIWCRSVGQTQYISLSITLYNMATTAIFCYFRVAMPNRPYLSGRVSVAILETIATSLAIVLPLFATAMHWTHFGFVFFIHRCTLLPKDYSTSYITVILVVIIGNLTIAAMSYIAIGVTVTKSRVKTRKTHPLVISAIATAHVLQIPGRAGQNHITTSTVSRSSKELKLVKVCLAKFIIFLLSYGPFLVIGFTAKNPEFPLELLTLSWVLVWLGISASPLVYGLLYPSIRREILKMLPCLPHICSGVQIFKRSSENSMEQNRSV